MEISTAPGSLSVATEKDKDDTAAAPISIDSTHPSHADQRQIEGIPKNKIEKIKGKGKDQKKHGVMSLPAEIRETYAFQSA